MTQQKTLKRRVRARMEKTGESYAAARRNVVAANGAAPEPEPEPEPAEAIAPIQKSDGSIHAATGRTWDEWYALLDENGATAWSHRDMAAWLVAETGITGWWAQTVTTAYEQARGIRVPGQRRDGTFEISATKTIAATPERVFDAFHDEELRARWLPGVEMRLRTARPGRGLRFDWEDGRTRVVIGLEAKDGGRCVAALAHQKLASKDEAVALKAYWRERLGELKRLLES